MRVLLKKLLILPKPVLALLILAVCALFTAMFSVSLVSFKQETIYIKSDTRLWPFNVEIAETPLQQQQGLMHREELAQNHGMLFISPQPTNMDMWMKNTPVPLDMLFINHQGRIIHIVPNTIPYSPEKISIKRKVRAVLEVPAGTTKHYQIKPGDMVMHPTFFPYLKHSGLSRDPATENVMILP